MKGFPSQRDFLAQFDLRSLSHEEISALKKQYRDAYHKAYNKQRKKKRSIMLRLSRSEYDKIQSAKSTYGHSSANAFVKEIVFSYLNKEIMVPHRSSIQDTVNAINKIGNNINQTVRRLNRVFLQSRKTQHPDSYEHLYRLLQGYEELVSQITYLQREVLHRQRVDYDIIGLSWSEIMYNQQGKLDQLITYLTVHKASLDADS